MHMHEPEDEPIGYIRGGGGITAEPKRVIRITALIMISALAVLTVALTVAAVRDNSKIRGLQSRGVVTPVQISSCLALASGTGITESGFTCSGTYAFRGVTRTSVVLGVVRQLAPGTMLVGVVDAAHPDIVATQPTVANAAPYARAFIPPGASMAAMALIALALRTAQRRRGKRSAAA